MDHILVMKTWETKARILPGSMSNEYVCVLFLYSASGVLKVPFLRAELLKFIEEKEFILKQRRVPTRQGTRPYSTPGMVG